MMSRSYEGRAALPVVSLLDGEEFIVAPFLYENDYQNHEKVAEVFLN
jgi:hypothetical protein